MNDENHIAENIASAEGAIPGIMTPDELEMMDEVKKVYQRLMKVECTGCAYCMPCPFGVNIPQCFSFYNRYYMDRSKLQARGFYGIQLMGGMGGTPAHASLCRNCGKCVKACPQHIAIPDELKKVAKTLDGLQTKMLIPLIRLMFRPKKSE